MTDRLIKQSRMDYMEKGASIGKPREGKKKTKGRATKVYSINRERLKEAIKIIDDVSKGFKDMLKKTEGSKNDGKKSIIRTK